MSRKKEKDARRVIVTFRVNQKEKKLLLKRFGSIAGVRDYALDALKNNAKEKRIEVPK